MLQKRRICHIPADKVTIVPIKKTQFENVVADEFKGRAEQDSKPACFFSAFKISFSLYRREPVDLVDLILNRFVSIMQ